jgi:hypothetical protein
VKIAARVRRVRCADRLGRCVLRDAGLSMAVSSGIQVLWLERRGRGFLQSF